MSTAVLEGKSKRSREEGKEGKREKNRKRKRGERCTREGLPEKALLVSSKQDLTVTAEECVCTCVCER